MIFQVDLCHAGISCSVHTLLCGLYEKVLNDDENVNERKCEKLSMNRKKKEN